MSAIYSDIIKINKNIGNIENIESKLAQKGEIIRWAIIDANEYEYKISFSYKTI